jgi:glycosyltransferase involved in cell wall biosynthesis
MSFLISAHNEEKRIGIALDSMARLKKMYPTVEVLCGNDGSTDRTEEIIKKYKFVRYFRTDSRQGKHYVIDQLIKMSKGDIIGILDADRIFVCKKGELEKLLDCFKDTKVGGVGDYYTTTFYKPNLGKANALYSGDAWSTLLMLEWKMKKYTKRIDGKLYANETGMMFYVNFFRKSLVEETKTMCDDGERFIQILNKGHRIRLLETEESPYPKASYYLMSFWGFYKTKLRGFIAQKQIDDLYGKFSIKPDTSLFFYILKSLHRTKSLRTVFGIIEWWIAIGFAFVKYQFIKNKKISTREGWKLRQKV